MRLLLLHSPDTFQGSTMRGRLNRHASGLGSKMPPQPGCGNAGLGHDLTFVDRSQFSVLRIVHQRWLYRRTGLRRRRECGCRYLRRPSALADHSPPQSRRPVRRESTGLRCVRNMRLRCGRFQQTAWSEARPNRRSAGQYDACAAYLRPSTIRTCRMCSRRFPVRPALRGESFRARGRSRPHCPCLIRGYGSGRSLAAGNELHLGRRAVRERFCWSRSDSDSFRAVLLGEVYDCILGCLCIGVYVSGDWFADDIHARLRVEAGPRRIAWSWCRTSWNRCRDGGCNQPGSGC